MTGSQLTRISGQPGSQALGCSRCRYAAGGCNRCRQPGFTPRGAKQALNQDEPPGDGRKRRRQVKQAHHDGDGVSVLEQQPVKREVKRGERHASQLLEHHQQQGDIQAQKQEGGGQQDGVATANLAQTVRKRLGRAAAVTTTSHSSPPDHTPQQQQQEDASDEQNGASVAASDGTRTAAPGKAPSQQQPPANQLPDTAAAAQQQPAADGLPHTPTAVTHRDAARQQETSARAPDSAAERCMQPPSTFLQMLQQRMDTQRQQDRGASRQQLLLTPQKAAQVGRSPAANVSPATSTGRDAAGPAIANTAGAEVQTCIEQVQRTPQTQSHSGQQSQRAQQEQQEQHRQQQQELQQLGAPLAVDQHVQDDAAMTEVLLAEAAATPTTSGSGRSGAAAAASSDADGAAASGRGKAKKKRKPQAKPLKKGAYAHLHRDGDPDPRITTWVPPQSPYCLLEEELYESPWRTLLACMLLNKTTGKQVRNVIWRLFELCPSPEAAVAADVAAIQDIIYPLGLFRKRAIAVQRFSQDYLNKQWHCPTELYGIGKYAADAYYIFCRGRWEGVEPDDKDLKKYLAWLQATGGQGAGLERTSPQQQQQPQPAGLQAAS